MTTASSDSGASSDLLQPRRGRKYTSLSLHLASFQCNANPPKMENIRYFLFRSIKRSVRHYLEKHCFGSSKLVKCGGQGSERLIGEIKELIRENRETFEDFADLKRGPKADHRYSQLPGRYKTYSIKYITALLQDPLVSQLYRLFVELIFTEADSEALCQRWRFHCCSGEHEADCTEKWHKFKDFLLLEGASRTN